MGSSCSVRALLTALISAHHFQENDFKNEEVQKQGGEVRRKLIQRTGAQRVVRRGAEEESMLSSRRANGLNR